jgi:hypothetical protein
MISGRSVELIGFSTNAAQPAACAYFRSASVPKAVTMMSGIAAVAKFDFSRRARAVHAGQLHVEHDHRGIAGLQRFECADGVGRLGNGEAGRFQNPACKPQLGRIVLNDQNDWS